MMNDDVKALFKEFRQAIATYAIRTTRRGRVCKLCGGVTIDDDSTMTRHTEACPIVRSYEVERALGLAPSSAHASAERRGIERAVKAVETAVFNKFQETTGQVFNDLFKGLEAARALSPLPGGADVEVREALERLLGDFVVLSIEWEELQRSVGREPIPLDESLDGTCSFTTARDLLARITPAAEMPGE